MSTIGFIGFGNIAQAIAKGACSGYITPDQIYIYDPMDEKNILATTYGYHTLKSAREVCSQSDFIFLTVKPQVYAEVLTEIRDVVSQDQCFISVAAGKTIDYVKSLLGTDCKVIRMMPNTPLLIDCGACGIAWKPPVTQADLAFVSELFHSCAVTQIVDEALIDAVTAVSGSGPAYVFSFAQAVIEEGTAMGLDRQTALSLFTATLIGSAKMMETGESCESLIQKVTSPKGTTAAALDVLEKEKFQQSIRLAMRACIQRAKELSKPE